MMTRDDEHSSASSIAPHATGPPLRRFLAALMLLTAVWSPAAPARAAENEDRHIEVVQVEGAIDPAVFDLITRSLTRASRAGASVVILQIDSDGALGTDPAALVRAVRESTVPVVVWVGPRAAARGVAAILVREAGLAAVSPGATVGPERPARLDSTSSGPAGAAAGRRFQGQAAVEAGVADFPAPTLGDVVVELNGRTVRTGDGEVTLSTTKVVETDDGPRQTANQPVRFRKLSALAGVQHALTSPAMAYLLLIVGLALIIFEFFTVGVGLASLVGAACLVGAFFGFSHLPAAWWAVAAILLSAFGFAVDVQAGHLGFWTGVGVLGLLAGSLGLYGGSSRLDLAWWQVALGVVSQSVFMLSGMTVAVRNRFSLPTVGRDSMIGEVGEARTDLDPDGVVVVRGAPWRARTNRGRPVPRGGPVRVVAVDQLVLEVESDTSDSAP
ncbi:MAG: NfeD family protein [Acidimicrobiia bacterium]